MKKFSKLSIIIFIFLLISVFYPLAVMLMRVEWSNFNNLITDWHDRNLKTANEILAFIEQRNKQKKDTKQLEKQVAKASFDQRQYDNLAFLYANSGVAPVEFSNTSNTDVPKVAASDFLNIKGDINV